MELSVTTGSVDQLRAITQEKVTVAFGCWPSASRKPSNRFENYKHLLSYPRLLLIEHSNAGCLLDPGTSASWSC